MREVLKRLAFSCLLAAGLVQSADAAVAVKPPTKPVPPKAIEYTGPVHPALFRIVKDKSTVYLFGSIHLLPPKFEWRTPVIEKAIASADVFMFEVNLDFATAEFHYFLDRHGYLQPGQTLHKMLSPTALEQYRSLIRNFQLDPNRVDYLRPGVAVLMLNQAAAGERLALAPGVDATLTRYGKQHAKGVGYLESVEFQLETLTAMGGGDDVAVLEKQLSEWKSDDAQQYEKLLGAWAIGDLATMSSMENVFDAKQRALLLDNRNKNWIQRIEGMLNTPKTHFITVGAAHLSGARSVIEILCGKGWKVERLQTGYDADAAPPDACGLKNSPLKRVASK